MITDRFFYNFTFFLPSPTPKMLEERIEGASTSPFDTQRFVAVAGREAFHVFDLKQNRFVSADFN